MANNILDVTTISELTEINGLTISTYMDMANRLAKNGKSELENKIKSFNKDTIVGLAYIMTCYAVNQRETILGMRDNDKHDISLNQVYNIWSYQS